MSYPGSALFVEILILKYYQKAIKRFVEHMKLDKK
jgi:hypothetical protein